MAEENYEKAVDVTEDTPVEAQPFYYEEPEKKAKKGSMLMAILAGSVLTVIIGFIMGSALNVDANLVDRYLAYMLGIFVIFVMSVLARSIWKMILFAMPIVLALQFGLAFLLPDFFSAPMAPFLSVIPIAIEVVTSAEGLGLDVASYQQYIDLVDTYGIALDFVIALFVGFFASIGLVLLTKVFTQKIGLLTVFRLAFGLVFFFIGVIIFPYFLVVVTGVSQFSMAFGVGGLALNEGFTLTQAGDLDAADEYFQEATYWFEQADAMLQGINDMRVFALTSMTIPDFQALITNSYLLIQSGVDLAKGIGPALSGVAQIQSGITQAMGVLNAPGTGLELNALSSTELAQFEEGIDIMEKGFGNLTAAFPAIEEAVNNLLLLDDEALLQSVNDVPQIQGAINEDNLGLFRGASELFLVVLNVLSVLISDADVTDDNISSPFVHLLKGALSLDSASSIVGDNTQFQGTTGVFQNAVSNFTIVVDSLNDPVFDELATADVGNDTTVIDIKNQMDGIVKFVRDAGEIAISVGEFGIAATPVLQRMNISLSILTNDYADFTEIPDEAFDNMINNLTINYPDAEYMAVLGAEVDFNVAIMEGRSTGDYYGFMQSQAADFVTTFKEFSLTENAANLFYLNGGFIGLIKTIQILGDVDEQFEVVQTDLDVISGLDTSSFDLSQVEIIQNTLVNVNGNLTEINDKLGSAIPPIDNAAGNFSLIGPSMPQMATTATSLDNIKQHIIDLQCTTGTPDKGFCRILVLTTEETFLSDPPTSIDETNLELNDVQLPFVSEKFNDIQSELAGVSIAS